MPDTATMAVGGACAPGFAGVRDAFVENFAQGLEVGAAFAATVDGELVVDIWGGAASPAGDPWRRDTIVNVWSSTKAMTAICVNLLADRGVIDLSRPVATWWPGFAQNGKSDITVHHLLSHSCALPDVSPPITVATLWDWERMVALLAAERPWWEPGTAFRYHAITYGHLLGELVRRVTGVTIGELFRTEVAEPLNADFHIGIGPALDQRVAQIVPDTAPPAGVSTDPIEQRLQMSHLLTSDMSVANRREWRAAEIPAANGHGNARSCARLMAMVACGGELDGVRILSAEAIDQALIERSTGLMGTKRVRYGSGFILAGSDRLPPSPATRVLAHGGAGGSLVVADVGARVSWAYVMNRMLSGPDRDPRPDRLAAALYAALGYPAPAAS